MNFEHNRQIDVTVVIVSYNTRDILATCLDSVLASTGIGTIETIVIDNASRDGSADMVAKRFPQVVLERSAINLGFAAANNVAFERARGRYVVLLNPDALLAPDTLATAVAQMDASPETGLGGGQLIGDDGSLQPSARQFPSLLNEVLVLSGLAARFPHSRIFGRFDRTWADPGRAAEVDWVPGAFTIVRREALDRVGGFDERFFLYYEEVDLCRRFRSNGWQVRYWPDIVVRHTGGESSKTVSDVEFTSSGSQLILWRMRSGLLYYRKHHGALTARLVAGLEVAWHTLRHLKARFSQAGGPKANESRRIAALMQRAWAETAGGQVSPPRPW